MPHREGNSKRRARKRKWLTLTKRKPKTDREQQSPGKFLLKKGIHWYDRESVSKEMSSVCADALDQQGTFKIKQCRDEFFLTLIK